MLGSKTPNSDRKPASIKEAAFGRLPQRERAAPPPAPQARAGTLPAISPSPSPGPSRPPAPATPASSTRTVVAAKRRRVRRAAHSLGRSSVSDSPAAAPLDKLEKYLADAEEPDLDIKVLDWWKAKERLWPNLAKMVKQYFAAPASCIIGGRGACLLGCWQEPRCTAT